MGPHKIIVLKNRIKRYVTAAKTLILSILEQWTLISHLKKEINLLSSRICFLYLL